MSVVEHHHSQASTVVKALSADHVGLTQRLQQVEANMLNLSTSFLSIRFQLLQENYELISPQARHGILRAQRFREPLGHLT